MAFKAIDQWNPFNYGRSHYNMAFYYQWPIKSFTEISVSLAFVSNFFVNNSSRRSSWCPRTISLDDRDYQVYYLYTFSNLIVIINLEVRAFSLKFVWNYLFIQTTDILQRGRTTNGKLALSICLKIINNWVCLNRREIYIV